MSTTKRLSVGVGGTLGPPVEDLLKRSTAAEQQGLDSIWWADHLMGWVPQSIWTPDISELASHSPSPHVYFDPVACIATAATVTTRVTLGVCVTDPIRRNPAMLANEFMTLHHMTHGRTVLGLGSGEGENIVPYGMDYRNSVSKLEEALAIIRALWASGGEPVNFAGDYFKFSNAVVALPGFEGTVPEIWVGANGPRMCSIAGQYADGFVPNMMPVDHYKTRLDWIRTSAKKHERLDRPFTAAMFSFLVLAEDHESAHKLMEHRLIKGLNLALPSSAYEELGLEHPMGAGAYGLKYYIPSQVDREAALRLVDGVPFEVTHRYILHGTPDDIVDQIAAYVDAGLSHLVIQNIGFMASLATAKSSYRLLGELVQQLNSRFNARGKPSAQMERV